MCKRNKQQDDMKRYNQYIILLATLMMGVLVGCQNEPAEVLQSEADYAFVELSSQTTTIAEKGGIKTIYIASNRIELEVQHQIDWLDVSVEGNAITIYVDANNSGPSRLGVIDVVAGSDPDVARARLKVLQEGSETKILSQEGTANCYIAKPNSTYRFDASVKGNAKRDGNSNYIAACGSRIEGASYAELAWEATFDGDKTRSTQIIDGTPLYLPEQKQIYFATGKSEGNALVTLHSADGQILWSWHIWVVADEVGTSTSADGLVWMDRNLGALNNNVGDVANRGMLYQWGRKEPFLPSPVEYQSVPTHRHDEDFNILESEEEYERVQAEIEAVRAVLNVNNEQRGEGIFEWSYVGEIAPVALRAPGNIDYALQNPTTFLGCRVDIPIGEYVFDWYLLQDLEGVGGLMQQSDSNLWGSGERGSDYKTIFDPCPVGYVVPPVGAFGEIPAGYACSYVGRDWEAADYGWTWSGGNGDYFPSVGNFDVSGLMGETSERMLYWTSESFGSGYQGFGKAATLFVAFEDIYYGIYPLMDGAEMAAWYSYGARCYGASVRCVKEQK